MLRVILATLGVALIAFGLFGGKSLEQVYAGLTGAFGKFNANDSSQVAVADLAVDETGSASPADSGAVVAVNATTNATTDDSKPAAVELSGTAEKVVQPLVTETATEADAGERKLSVANVVADDKEIGTLAKVSADSGSDDGGAMKEVKASARNEEQALAEGTTDEGGAEFSKEADVGGILLTTTGGNKVEALFVLKDLVNMRQGPSIEHEVVLRLEKGQELMEFKRDGKWVHVGAYGTSGKIGWVHERLVGKTPG